MSEPVKKQAKQKKPSSTGSIGLFCNSDAFYCGIWTYSVFYNR